MNANANAFRIPAALINVVRPVLITQNAIHEAGTELRVAHAEPTSPANGSAF
jgi:hypothetical protein